MDTLIYGLLTKEIKKTIGASYVSSISSSDTNNVYLDVTYKKKDASTDTVRLTFPKPLNGVNGINGVDGEDGLSIVSASFVGNDMVFTRSDSSTLVIVGAKTLLTPNIESKQDLLVSGNNIKTINGNSILGFGDLIISGGGGGAVNSVNGQVGVVVLDADDISDTTTANKFVTVAEKTNIANSVAHITNTSNPHNTTKAQVGLGNVDNTSDLNKPISLLQQEALNSKANSDNVYNKIESDNRYESKNINIQNHISSILNPHNVTKEQIGLNNVDNTSDLNKPISTATQTALDTKQDTLVSGTSIKTINGQNVLGKGNLSLLTSTNPAITGSITEQVYNLTGAEINPANGTIQYKTVSANTTFTETLISGQSVLLRLINANSYTITFPTITWVGAVVPTLTANCVIVLWKEQSTLYGSYVGTLV